jgi:hypothetical protein
LVLGLFLIAALGGCALNKKLTVAGTAALLEDVARAASKQSDLRLVREAMPAFLLLMDGMVEGWPDNERLLLAAAQAYSSFASVLAEENDPVFREVLLTRSKDYALRALAQRGIADPAGSAFDEFEKAVGRTTSADLPGVFWAASCWAGWIAAQMGSIEALAELPRVEALMRRALALDESYYYGGPHLFMGILDASRPPVAGGSLSRAEAHFSKALEFGQGKFLMTQVYYAEFYARKAFERELFVATLEKVLATPADAVPELTLLNSVARRKAEKLIARADEFF